MSATDTLDEVVVVEAGWLPIAHLPLPGDPRKALCGAEVLGIPAFPPWEECAECNWIADKDEV